jgi:hypothetical protein
VFPGQRPDEKVLYCIRMHWIIHLKILLQLIFALLLPVAIYFGVRYTQPDVLESQLWLMFWLVCPFYALFVMLHFFIM